MKKLKVGRKSLIEIKKEEGTIEHSRWVAFVDSHQEYFIWYEDTKNGKRVKKNLKLFSGKQKERILYNLGRTAAYSTDKIVKDPYALIIRYQPEGYVWADIEIKLTIEVATLLLRMAEFFEAKTIIDGKNELISIEQVS